MQSPEQREQTLKKIKQATDQRTTRMISRFFVGLGVGACITVFAAIIIIFSFRHLQASLSLGIPFRQTAAGSIMNLPGQKSPQELLADALEKSKNIKALYMTADVANDISKRTTKFRNHLISLAEDTELNSIVIDVKEVCGADLNEERIAALVKELQKKEIWTIARIVVFKDGSQILAHPDWYLSRTDPASNKEECTRKMHLRAEATDQTPQVENYLWKDRRGGHWLDAAHPEVLAHVTSFSKEIIDLGFDELQFDYVRFPSDGDIENAIYPVWDGITEKPKVLDAFFSRLKRELRSYKPDIILSADLFGQVAVLGEDFIVGQRLDEMKNHFDYLSFMLYPSHYYNGFYVPPDPARGLPAINYTVGEARANPGVIIERSLLVADKLVQEFLPTMVATTTTIIKDGVEQEVSTTTEVMVPKPRTVRFRPWIEDFYHEADAAAGRPSGVEKVRLQIDGAERSENHGWLLWNAANVYTEGALNPK